MDNTVADTEAVEAYVQEFAPVMCPKCERLFVVLEYAQTGGGVQRVKPISEAGQECPICWKEMHER